MSRDFLGEHHQPAWSVLVDVGPNVAVASAASTEPPLKKLAAIAGTDPLPVFDFPEYRASKSSAARIASFEREDSALPEVDRFVEFSVAGRDEANNLAKEIRKAAVSPGAEVIPVPTAVPALGPVSMEPKAGSLPLGPPNLFSLQAYMAPGPYGFGFLDAWRLPGGDGRDVTIIDVEGGWRTTHAELESARFSLWSGKNTETEAWQDHGCAVVSLLAASHNGSGTSAIAPGARVGMVSVFEIKAPGRQRTANQILEAGTFLNPGDVMLLELQRPGPRTDFADDTDQKGYIPLTYWPDVRAVVHSLVGRGITVVSVAGNGGENLDDAIYEGRFDRESSDAGCILVGAGAPPFGGFGRPRSRLAFSNYGSAVDVQAWGQMVVTAGYGDLWGGREAPDLNYTGRFMGTSAAAPLIAGLVACIQGRHKAVFGVPVNPLFLREMLRKVGWRAEDDDGAERGKSSFSLQPDLAQMFARLGIA